MIANTSIRRVKKWKASVGKRTELLREEWVEKDMTEYGEEEEVDLREG